MRSLAAPLFAVFLVACSSGDDSTLDASSGEDATSSTDSALPAEDAARPEAAPPPPACDVIGDAAFPDAYYPSASAPCTKAGDPCALPPNECVFDRYRIRYLKGYCSSGLTCVFTYTREECGGAEPVGCDAGVCTCAP